MSDPAPEPAQGARVVSNQRCGVTHDGRPCGKPAVSCFKFGALLVLACAECEADIDDQIKGRLKIWAAQLANGASVDDLEVRPGGREQP